jgi:hypothetical protein
MAGHSREGNRILPVNLPKLPEEHRPQFRLENRPHLRKENRARFGEHNRPGSEKRIGLCCFMGTELSCLNRMELSCFNRIELSWFNRIELCCFMGIELCRFMGIELCRFMGIELCRFMGIELCRFMGIELCRFMGIELCRFMGIALSCENIIANFSAINIAGYPFSEWMPPFFSSRFVRWPPESHKGKWHESTIYWWHCQRQPWAMKNEAARLYRLRIKQCANAA